MPKFLDAVTVQEENSVINDLGRKQCQILMFGSFIINTSAYAEFSFYLPLTYEEAKNINSYGKVKSAILNYFNKTPTSLYPSTFSSTDMLPVSGFSYTGTNAKMYSLLTIFQGEINLYNNNSLTAFREDGYRWSICVRYPN